VALQSPLVKWDALDQSAAGAHPVRPPPEHRFTSEGVTVQQASDGSSQAPLLVQPRPRSNSAYVVYGDALDAPEVHIHIRVIEDMRSAALEALPHATIGALLGRPCRDAYGIYVVVAGTVVAARADWEAAAQAIRLSDGGRRSLRQRAAHRHPTLEPVGCWHSHPRAMPRYIAVDDVGQATSPSAYRVRIVLAAAWLQGDASQHDPLGVHVGPSATLLARRTPDHDELPQHRDAPA
jgi:JAB domain-containing protein similar to deubiquitination enzymes